MILTALFWTLAASTALCSVMLAICWLASRKPLVPPSCGNDDACPFECQPDCPCRMEPETRLEERKERAQ